MHRRFVCFVLVLLLQLLPGALAEKIYFTSFGTTDYDNFQFDTSDSFHLLHKYIVEYDAETEAMIAVREIPLNAILIRDPKRSGQPYIVCPVDDVQSQNEGTLYSINRYSTIDSVDSTECEPSKTIRLSGQLLGIDAYDRMYTWKDVADHPIYGDRGRMLLCEEEASCYPIAISDEMMKKDNWHTYGSAISDSGIVAWSTDIRIGMGWGSLLCICEKDSYKRIEMDFFDRSAMCWKDEILYFWRYVNGDDVLYLYDHKNSQVEPVVINEGKQLGIGENAAAFEMSISENGQMLATFVIGGYDDWYDYYNGYRIVIIDLSNGSIRTITPWEQFSDNGVLIENLGAYTDNGVFLINPHEVDLVLDGYSGYTTNYQIGFVGK